ncbi:MAG TPA: hypothetical protein VI036_10655 [Propionibacteriaceae bacterium]
MKGEPRRVTIGVTADREELKAWGRAAALRRQQLPNWISSTLSAAAEVDEQRSSPLPHFQSREPVQPEPVA